MADEIVKQQPQETDPRVAAVQAYLFKRKIQLERVMPRGELTVDRLIATALMAAKKTDALLACDPESIFLSVMDAAELGLSVHWGPRGEAALVPFGKKCTLMIGYRGLLICAKRGASLREICADVCRANDDWRYQVTQKGQIFRHEPRHDEAEPRLYYCASWFRDSDGCQVTVTTKAKVERIRQMVLDRAGQKDSPWKTWPVEMGIKTGVRQHMKLLPSYDSERALELEERHAKERGEYVDGTVVHPPDRDLHVLPPPASREVIEVSSSSSSRQREAVPVQRVQQSALDVRTQTAPAEEGTKPQTAAGGTTVANQEPTRHQAAAGGGDPDSFTDQLMADMRAAVETGSEVTLRKLAGKAEHVPPDRQEEVTRVYSECKQALKARAAQKGGAT